MIRRHSIRGGGGLYWLRQLSNQHTPGDNGYMIRRHSIRGGGLYWLRQLSNQHTPGDNGYMIRRHSIRGGGAVLAQVAQQLAYTWRQWLYDKETQYSGGGGAVLAQVAQQLAYTWRQWLYDKETQYWGGGCIGSGSLAISIHLETMVI